MSHVSSWRSVVRFALDKAASYRRIVQHQQSPALGKPCLGGGRLLLGRPSPKPKLELPRHLGRDLGNGTLAAKLKHDRVERSLCLLGKLERER